MRHLILVKHSLPQIDPAVPAADWRLGNEGRRRCGLLAERLAVFRPAAVVASAEPKATETGRIVAERLGVSFAVAPGLHEHDRRGVPYLDGATFEASVERFFARPDDLVFGNETAAQAGERFAAAVERALAQHPSGDVGVVAHGTVVSLFVARHAGVDPFALWRRLGLPSFVVFSLPDLRLLTTVENIEGLGSRRVSQRSTVP